MMSPDQAFAKDIPRADHEAVLTILAEAAQGTEHQCVTVLERDRYDAINVHASMILEWAGKEYSVHLEDGNWNGTVLRGWETTGQEFEYHTPVELALRPIDRLVAEAIEKGKGPFLVAKWDALLLREEIASIPGKFTYDRRAQPGEVVSRYWRGKAAEHLFEIVTKEEADETRTRLNRSTQGGGE